MKIILTTNSEQAATALKNNILNVIKGKDRNDTIETWTYDTGSDGSDVIFHNPEQFVNDPAKHVIFFIKVEDNQVIFLNGYKKNTKKIYPSYDMRCYHTGRLTEILLVHFGNDFTSFEIEQ